MPIDYWFPLAIYYTDLENAQTENQRLKKTILELEELSGVERKNTRSTAWTGDVHGFGQIHFDERFRWIVENVESSCFEYMTELGIDLTMVTPYIQRSWPIICRHDEVVSIHAHHNANISAVYYVDIPISDEESDVGPIVFHNMHNQNEVQKGMSTESTSAIANWNETNIKSCVYIPTPGRLVLFPSKQHHSVGPNLTKCVRISLSFDIALVAAETVSPDTYEFLLPPPQQWKPFDQNPLHP